MAAAIICDSGETFETGHAFPGERHYHGRQRIQGIATIIERV